MRLDPEEMRHGTRVPLDGKQLYLDTCELPDYVAFMGDLKIVKDNKEICNLHFCIDTYCEDFGSRFAEMKIKRIANMHLIGHPLLNTQWVRRTTYGTGSQEGQERFVLEKYLDSKNFVYANYCYERVF